jgi:hypothetical protein
MKVYSGNSDHKSQRNAREWVELLKKYPTFFSDLESWAVGKKAELGECHIFIEIYLPLPKDRSRKYNRRQIDLLICFSKLLIFCELKRSPIYRLNINDSYDQIEAQTECFKQLLKESGFNPEFIFPFLLPSRLNTDELKTVETKLKELTAYHVWVAGTRHNRNRYYLPKLLELRLKGVGTTVLSGGRSDLQKFFEYRLNQEELKLSGPFRDFNEAITHLEKFVLPTMRLDFEPGFVVKLRQDKLNDAVRIFKEKGIVEITAPPGAGKTAFVKELIKESLHSGPFAADIELNLCEIQQIRACQSLHDLRLRIERAFYGKNESFGDETFIQEVVDQPYTFWITEYDKSSEQSLAQFLQRVRSLFASAATKSPRSRWIIESTLGLQGLNECRCKLEPLDSKSISRIIRSVNPGGGVPDPERVIRMAHGSPKQAIYLWRSQRLPDAQDYDERFDWFRSTLSTLEDNMLCLLCFVMARFPLGVTSHFLSRLGKGVFRTQLKSDIESSLESLLEKLQNKRLATIARFSRSIFSDLLDAATLERLPVTFIDSVEIKLLEDALSSISDDEQSAWREIFVELLEKSQHCTLEHVTWGIETGDLEPFFRSSFRPCYLRKLLGWINSTRWEVKQERLASRQEYILKAIRILARLDVPSSAINVEDELGEPQEGDEAQRFAFELTKARAMTKKLITAEFDLSAWLLEIENYEDSALRAELYVMTASALPRSGRRDGAAESWHILNGLCQKLELSSAAKCLITSEALAYLNLTRFRGDMVDNGRAYHMIRQLSRELIESGLGLENYQLVCDALFYCVRSQECREWDIPYDEAVECLRVIRFLEDIEGRFRRRLQILLTQGSIHMRFFCSQKNIKWEKFQQHMAEGFECYLRALKSAESQPNVMHILNSACYLMELCLKSLCFAGDKDAESYIISKSKEATTNARDAEQQVAPKVKGAQEQNLLKSLRRFHTILLYVITVSAKDITNDARISLRGLFDDCVSSLLGEANVLWGEEADKTFNFITQAFSYGLHHNGRNFEFLMKELHPCVKRLLDRTSGLMQSGGRLTSWRTLSQIISS